MSLRLALLAFVCLVLAACAGDESRSDNGRFNGAYGGVSGGVCDKCGR